MGFAKSNLGALWIDPYDYTNAAGKLSEPFFRDMEFAYPFITTHFV